MSNILLGAHFSIAGGLHKAFSHAEKYGCRAIQIFTQNSSTWKIREVSEEEVSLFREAWEKSCVENVTAHAGYLINLAGPDNEKNEKSRTSLGGELKRADLLNIDSLVLHPGSHVKTSISQGIQRISDNVNRIFEKDRGKTKIAFETMAGQGDSIGSRLEHIKSIIDKIENRERTAVCIDTCHLFASGYDLGSEEKYNAFMDEFTDFFGVDSLECIHLNDSKKELGSRVDRHDHIGHGLMGLEPFKFIIRDKRLAHVPKILETAHEKDGKDMNMENFGILKSFL